MGKAEVWPAPHLSCPGAPHAQSLVAVGLKVVQQRSWPVVGVGVWSCSRGCCQQPGLAHCGKGAIETGSLLQQPSGPSAPWECVGMAGVIQEPIYHGPWAPEHSLPPT